LSLPKSKKDYLFVTIQFALFVIYIIPISLTTINLPEWLRYAGLFIIGIGSILGVVALLQLNTKLSPFPTPVAQSKLITNGAFAIARHPIYTTVLTVTLGYAIFSVSVFKVLVGVALLILFYFKSKYEETLLLQKFPAYKDYKQQTRRFI